MPGNKLPILTITNRQYFRDGEMYIDGRTDGTLNITSDSAITLDGDISLTSGDDFTIVDGAVDLGTGALTIGGAATIAGDLTRQSVRYMSGTAAAMATGFTRCTAATTLPDEGIMYFSGVSGNLYPKLLTSATRGQTLSLVYTNSGALATYTLKVSGSSLKSGGNNTTFYYLTFNYPGDAMTLTSDGTSWYSTTPSGGGTSPAWSTT